MELKNDIELRNCKRLCERGQMNFRKTRISASKLSRERAKLLKANNVHPLLRELID
jgi:hypothetical protein